MELKAGDKVWVSDTDFSAEAHTMTGIYLCEFDGLHYCKGNGVSVKALGWKYVTPVEAPKPKYEDRRIYEHEGEILVDMPDENIQLHEAISHPGFAGYVSPLGELMSAPVMWTDAQSNLVPFKIKDGPGEEVRAVAVRLGNRHDK